jgi:flagellar M-ring protein FliF
MPEILVRLWQRIIELWNGFERSQKIRLVVTAGILGIAIVVGIYFVAKPNFYTVASSTDIAQLTEYKTALDTAKIENHFNENQTAILVNMIDRDNALVALQAGGFLQAGKTFDEALGSISITSTQDDKKKIWQNWSQSEIEQLLKKGNTIKDVEVILQIPDQSILFENNAETTAAVKVMAKNPNGLTPEQVNGIIDLVTGAVKGLTPDKVKITDFNMNPLHGTDTSDEMGAITSQYKMKQQVKEKWEKDIRDLLPASTDSYDAFSIVAEPKLDYDKQTSQSTEYTNPNDSQDPSILSSKSSKTTATGDTSGQAPGTNTNPATGSTTTYPTGTGTGSSYKSESNEVDNIYNKKTTDLNKATGQPVTDLSTVSIILKYGSVVKDAVNITPQLITDIKNTVSMATGGIPVARISVTSFKIAPVTVIQPTITDQVTQMVNDFGLPIILTLLALALMIMAVPRKKKVLAPIEEMVVNADGTVTAGPSGPRFVVPEAEEPVPEIDLEEKSEIKKQIEKFVTQKPDAVAQLLRNWLQEDDWE